MKNGLVCFLVTFLLLTGCSRNLPIFDEDQNFDTVIMNGTEYALQKLSYDGQSFVSEPEQLISPEDYEHFQLGKQIGKTEDGLRIYEVENDKKRIALQGFMFPTTYYKLCESKE